MACIANLSPSYRPPQPSLNNGPVQRRVRRAFVATGQSVLSTTQIRSSSDWNDDDYDVLADGVVVGRIMKAAAVQVGQSWMWTLMFGHHEDRNPTHGYAATREAAMSAFAKSWRRE
jgi:hypothetical protein